MKFFQNLTNDFFLKKWSETPMFLQYYINGMENTNYHKKSVDELTFTDDGTFQKVLHNPEICAENRYVELVFRMDFFACCKMLSFPILL